MKFTTKDWAVEIPLATLLVVIIIVIIYLAG